MVSVTINSNAYIFGITKSSYYSDLFRLIYNRIVNNVDDPQSPQRTKWWFPSFPDYDLDNADSFPIGVIDSPDSDWSKRSLHTKWINLSFNVDLYCTSMSQLDSLSNQVEEAIEGAVGDFHKIKVKFVNLDGTSTDHYKRDEIMIHNRTFSYSCMYRFTKTA